jgi:hypothetical protein
MTTEHRRRTEAASRLPLTRNRRISVPGRLYPQRITVRRSPIGLSVMNWYRPSNNMAITRYYVARSDIRNEWREENQTEGYAFIENRKLRKRHIIENGDRFWGRAVTSLAQFNGMTYEYHSLRKRIQREYEDQLTWATLERWFVDSQRQVIRAEWHLNRTK